MTMKIDEAEQYLIALKHCETCEADNASACKTCEYRHKGSSAKCYDAIDVGVDIIHKYKKIEEIANEWNNYRNGISSSQGDSIYMQKVSEVIEGTNN